MNRWEGNWKKKMDAFSLRSPEVNYLPQELFWFDTWWISIDLDHKLASWNIIQFPKRDSNKAFFIIVVVIFHSTDSQEKKMLLKFLSLTNRRKCEVPHPHYFSTWDSKSSTEKRHEDFDASRLCPQRKRAQPPKQRSLPGCRAGGEPTDCVIEDRYQNWEVV